MEKVSLDIERRPGPSQPRCHGHVKLQLFLTLCCAAYIACVWKSDELATSWSRIRPKQPRGEKREFSWDAAPALPYLKYENCYDGVLQCARLELPMDYWNDTTNDTIVLAVIRRPAALPVTHPRYGGPVLLNPGGPGGSGVEFVINSGKQIGKILHSGDGKVFDVVSFDPRGVGRSTPQMRCMESPWQEHNWSIRLREEGIFGSSNGSLGRLWSMATAYGQSCSILPDNGRPDIREYMTTASVARDMVSLIEAHGQWREQEVARLSGNTRACRAAKDKNMPCADVPEPLRYMKGEEKLQYWGFSYGSYLGLTYAAMFPDKVRRLVVDGVVDAYDYRRTLWFDNLMNTELDMRSFYYHCARVGFPTCALANETAETTEAGVRRRVINITGNLLRNPLPVIQAGRPEVITYSDVKNLVFASLYSPLESFPFLANMLASIEKGDAIFFADFFLDYFKPDWNDCGQVASISEALRNKSHGSLSLSDDTNMAISCTDGEDQTWLDRSVFEEHVKNLTKLSPSIGPMFAEIRMRCAHYKVRPRHRFTAPWEGNTSHPILLIANTADPVTPLWAAKKMARGFKNAVVLTQDAPGHCTLAAPSNCTAGYVRRYFQSGDMPHMNTTCNVDAIPFGPGPDEGIGVVDDDTKVLEEDLAIVRAALYRASGFFMSGGQRQYYHAWLG